MTKRMQRLTRKRNNRIKDYMHKVSRYLADYCEQHHEKSIPKRPGGQMG